MVVQLQRQIDAGQTTKHTPGASSSMSERERSVGPIIASEACGGPAWRNTTAVAECAAKNSSASTWAVSREASVMRWGLRTLPPEITAMMRRSGHGRTPSGV